MRTRRWTAAALLPARRPRHLDALTLLPARRPRHLDALTLLQAHRLLLRGTPRRLDALTPRHLLLRGTPRRLDTLHAAQPRENRPLNPCGPRQSRTASQTPRLHVQHTYGRQATGRYPRSTRRSSPAVACRGREQAKNRGRHLIGACRACNAPTHPPLQPVLAKSASLHARGPPPACSSPSRTRSQRCACKTKNHTWTPRPRRPSSSKVQGGAT